MKNLIKDEPVMVGSVVAAVMSFLGMGVALGWFGFGSEQLSSIREFLVAGLPLIIPASVLIGGWWGRQRVKPRSKLPSSVNWNS